MMLIKSYITATKNNAPKTAKDLAQYLNYEDLLARKDIDAVVIGTLTTGTPSLH